KGEENYMKGTSRNDDFVFLAVAPVLAAVAFFIFYVGGWIPMIPVPHVVLPWGSSIDNLQLFASQNEVSAITVAVAIVMGTIGVTWVVMVVLDLKRGLQAFVRWILRRPPHLVSGILRDEAKPAWSIYMT